MYANNAKDGNGESFIPASQRPDGTWRKARRVKEGYVPQEEVPLYESKGKQFINKQQTKEPVRLASGLIAHPSVPGLYIDPDKEKTKSKNKKRNKKVDELTKELDKVKVNETKVVEKDTKSKSTNQESTDPAKKLKNLKKRLREVEALEEKLQNGQIAKPESEQLAKVKRKPDLLMQIRQLEKELALN